MPEVDGFGRAGFDDVIRRLCGDRFPQPPEELVKLPIIRPAVIQPTPRLDYPQYLLDLYREVVQARTGVQSFAYRLGLPQKVAAKFAPAEVFYNRAAPQAAWCASMIAFYRAFVSPETLPTPQWVWAERAFAGRTWDWWIETRDEHCAPRQATSDSYLALCQVWRKMWDDLRSRALAGHLDPAAAGQVFDRYFPGPAYERALARTKLSLLNITREPAWELVPQGR